MMSSTPTNRNRGRPPNFTLDELLRIIMRECLRSKSSWVSQGRLKSLTKIPKSTLSRMIRKLRKHELVTTRKVRMGKSTHSFVTISFRKRFITDLSKIPHFKDVIECPSLFIGTDPPTHVFGQLPNDIENNIYIAAHLKEYLRTHGNQEAEVLELIPQISDITPDQPLHLSVPSALVAKQYIEDEGGQESLVLELIPATKLIKEVGVVGT